MRLIRAAVLTGLAAALLSGAEDRRKLWDLNLSRFVNQAEMAAQVWGIRFSPDETRVAIGFGSRWNFDPSPRHIVVVALDHPQIARYQFELTGGRSPSGNNLVWSPSGKILVARTKTPIMFLLDSGAACVFPNESEFGGFPSPDRMVIYVRDKAEIQILNPDCSLADRWDKAGSGGVLDTSPEGDLLAIETILNPPAHTSIELVASRTHERKQHRIWDTLSTGVAFFFPIRASSSALQTMSKESRFPTWPVGTHRRP